MILTFSER